MSIHSATVIDLSAYRERRRADATVAAHASSGHPPAPGVMGFVLVPAPYMMMWAPVWFAPPHVGTGNE